MLADTAPQVTVSGWVPWTIAFGSLAAAATSIVVFFKKVALPFADVVATMRRDFPIIRDIAETFGREGQETISIELRALAANDEVSAANQKALMAGLDSVIAKADLLDLRLKETRHDIIGNVLDLKAGPAEAKTLVDAIVRTSSELQQVREQLQKMQVHPPEDS